MSTYNGYTPARAKANAKYIAQFADIKLRVPPEKRDEIKAAAAAAGVSVNTFILEAIYLRMQQEK